MIERSCGNLQREMINRLHLQDEVSIKYFCQFYKEYYNHKRPHQGIDGAIPSKTGTKSLKIVDLQSVKYEKIKHAHGLFTEFKIAA